MIGGATIIMQRNIRLIGMPSGNCRLSPIIHLADPNPEPIIPLGLVEPDFLDRAGVSLLNPPGMEYGGHGFGDRGGDF